VTQFVGRFGWLDTSMPEVAYFVAGAVYLVLLVGALWIGTKKDRGLLLVAIGLSVVANVVLDAATQAPYGFRFQARFCLPFIVLVPMLCCAIIGRSGNRATALRRRESGALLGVSLLLVLIQAVAWWTNSRQSAVGVHGPWLFLTGGAWHPPIGWVLPIALLVAALALLLTASVANARSVDRRSGTADRTLSVMAQSS
jgi:hypothetical protein